MRVKQPLPMHGKSLPMKQRCSRCRLRAKRPLINPRDPHTVAHHWCTRCYIEAPLNTRHRRASRADKRRLREKLEARATIVRQKKAEKLAAADALKGTSKTANTAGSSKRKNSGKNSASSSLDYEPTAASDKTLYEEDLEF